MSSIKVGYLTPFTVIKNLPNFDSYLVSLPGTGLVAQLPKKYAQKKYKLGESGWAAIFEIDSLRIVLSQKSTQYVRKIMEYVLSPLIESGKIRVKRVAKLSKSNFFKVAIEADNIDREALFKLCQPFLDEKIKDYIHETICIVKYSKDLKDYVINALAPAPASAVRNIILSYEEGQAVVYVEDSSVGIFMGKKGENVLTAAKLVGVNIKIVGV